MNQVLRRVLVGCGKLEVKRPTGREHDVRIFRDCEYAVMGYGMHAFGECFTCSHVQQVKYGGGIDFMGLTWAPVCLLRPRPLAITRFSS